MNWSDYKDFEQWEFDCKHTRKNNMRPEFMQTLQQIRNAYNKPMVISSGYRDFTHPIEKAKKQPGEHYYGVAADISVYGVDAMELLVIAYGHGIRRIGVADNFIHLGTGDRKYNFPPDLWTYKKGRK